MVTAHESARTRAQPHTAAEPPSVTLKLIVPEEALVIPLRIIAIGGTGALLACLAVYLHAAESPDEPKDVEARITALLARMTLEEKIGQMSQAPFGPLTDQIKSEIRQGRWGSFFNAATPADRAEAQRIATRESRLHIPLLIGQDVIHGYETVFPIPLGQAASWDPELVRQAARIAAREAAQAGIDWAFSPMVDIARDPRWGRIAEGAGEDPYLAGAMAAAITRGYQGDRLSASDSIAACVKHYVGYGAAEGGRDYNATWIPEVLLRNVYLKPFQAAREAGAATFMSAFNTINGIPATGDEFTLRQVLRREWQFDGFVVSDYNAVREMIAHGYAADDADAARRAIRAGVDMEMFSTTYWDHAAKLVAAGELDPTLIDESVRDILRIKFRLGLFDGRAEAPASAPQSTPEALSIARKLAAESMVLLKNESPVLVKYGGTLPLSKSIGKLAVIGFLADSKVDQNGTWAMTGGSTTVTPLAALRQVLGSDRVVYAQGLKGSTDTSRAGFAAALEAARSSDAVLLFLGEEASMSGEATSRAYLNLPGLQEELATEVEKAGKPVIVIIMAGRPTTFHNVAAGAMAVLYAWAPGAMGGPAIADLVFGDAVPSGRLPVTFPRTVGQVPIYYDHLSTGRPPALAGPAATDKYRSKYIDVSFLPEYPFGYGLSYTKFDYSHVRVSPAEVKLGGGFTVSADISNSGGREADEVVQLYTHQMAGSEARPVRELKGFQRIHLKPGEKRTVTFHLTTDDLAFYNPQMKRAAEPGGFEAWVAPYAASGEKAAFRVVQ